MSQGSDGRPKIGIVQLQQAIEAIAVFGAAGARSPEDVDILQRAFKDAAKTVTMPAPSSAPGPGPGPAMGEQSRAWIGIDPEDGRVMKIFIDPWPPVLGPKK
jgi:hypothetical protein